MVAAVKEEIHGEIRGVSFSASMHTLMGLDADERPLTACITYADNRATEQAVRIRAEMEGSAIHDRTGTPIHPMSPLAKLLWFRERDVDTFGRTAKWVSFKEYLFYRLFDEYVMDYSIASATGLFNLQNLNWDYGVLEMLSLSEKKLSRPVLTTHVVEGLNPEYVERLGLEPGTPFVVGANYGVLANLGVGATEPGVVACSIGTSGAGREITARPRLDDGGRLFRYALTEDRWVVGGPINNGVIALGWLRDGLSPDLGAAAEEQGRDSYELMEELAGGGSGRLGEFDLSSLPHGRACAPVERRRERRVLRVNLTPSAGAPDPRRDGGGHLPNVRCRPGVGEGIRRIPGDPGHGRIRPVGPVASDNG